MEYIKVQRKDIVKIGIADENGIPKKDEKGNELCLEFDVADIRTINNLSKCEYLIQKAQTSLLMKIKAIDNKQNNKGKGILTDNERAKSDALRDYYQEMEKAIDLFIGEGGTQKVFGKRRYWEMWQDLSEMLEPFLPQLKLSVKDMTDRIVKKYKLQEENVLKDE